MLAAITQEAGNPWPKIWTGPAASGLPPNSFILIVEKTVPRARLWIERSLVPKKIVVTASITCDNPKNRMIDSISGFTEPCSRGTNIQ